MGIAVGESIDLWQRSTKPELSMAYHLLNGSSIIHPFLLKLFAKRRSCFCCYHVQEKEERDADDVCMRESDMSYTDVVHERSVLMPNVHTRLISPAKTQITSTCTTGLYFINKREFLSWIVSSTY